LSGARLAFSYLESRLLEVKLADDAVHRLVRELALRPPPRQRLALRGQNELDHLLIGERAVLVAVVLDLPGLCGEPALAVVVEGAHPLHRLVPRPVLVRELVDLFEGGLRGHQSAPELL